MGETDGDAEGIAIREPMVGRAIPGLHWLTVTMVVLAAATVGVWLLLQRPAAAADAHLDGEIVDFDILVPDGALTVGDTVTFTNSGDRPHTVTDRGNTFDTDGIAPGESGEVTFTAAGAYEIFCRINPGTMNATVVVEPGDEDPAQVRVQTFDPKFDPRDEELRFDPPELQVRPGTEINVANVSGVSHTFTAEDGTFDTGEIAPGVEEGRFAGDNISFTVEETGVFEYFCAFHPEAMQGTLIVSGDPLDVDDPDPPPDDPVPPDEVADPGADAAESVELTMEDFAFAPFEVAITPGGEMRWSNTGGAPHTATFDDVEGRVEGLDTGTVSPGDEAVLTAPDAPGSYSYLCTIHPSMRGVVVVAADGAVATEENDSGVGATDVAAPPPSDDGGYNTPALVGAIVLVLAGLGAIAVALRGRQRDEAAES